MGKINRVMTKQMLENLPPYFDDFVKQCLETPTWKLPELLARFPHEWPLPRDDLHHWIPLLNLFDDVLAEFVKAYELDDGPQTSTFAHKFFDNDKTRPVVPEPAADVVPPSDEDVIIAVLHFTGLLLDNCHNRNLYRSTERLNHLLNTTSNRLLEPTLYLTFRLAKRFNASRMRWNNPHALNHLTKEIYDLNLENLLKIALPLPLPTHGPVASPTTPTPKGKDKDSRRLSRSGSDMASDSFTNPSDMMSVLKLQDVGKGMGVLYSFYQKPGVQSQDDLQTPRSASAGSTTVLRRSSTMASVGSNSEAKEEAHSGMNHMSHLIIPIEELRDQPLEDVVKCHVGKIPKEFQYDFLHKLRQAYAMAKDQEARCAMVAVRLLAVANLAYVYTESNFEKNIFAPMSEDPKMLQLPQQLAGLVQPLEPNNAEVPQHIQTYALYALESLCLQKAVQVDICSALGANVNYGTLFYLVRKYVSLLKVEEEVDEKTNEPIIDYNEEAWRDALFELLKNIPSTTPRAAENLHSAGLLEILNEVITLRTSKAMRNHWRIIRFLDYFIFSVRESLATYIGSRGLEILNDLLSHVVKDCKVKVDAGEGMKADYLTRQSLYEIPFYGQSTLYWGFRFLNRLMRSSGTTFSRHIRNLFDSPLMLGSLHEIISQPQMFGAIIWSTAVNTLTSFIHNEPTSYSVIAEAKLNESFLKILEKKIGLQPVKESEFVRSRKPLAGNSMWDEVPNDAIIPHPDAIYAVPNAIGALCLNEAGLEYFKTSNAFSNFLEIFESYPHAIAMSWEPDVARMIGEAFDELVRHHQNETTGLKTTIISAVLRMLERVSSRVRMESYNYGVGTKLFKNPEGSLYNTEDGQDYLVAGGRNAFRGFETDLDAERRQYQQDVVAPIETRPSGDVEMDDSTSTRESTASLVEPPNPSPNQDVPASLVEDNDSLLHPSILVSRALKFIMGFCSGAPTKRAFIEAGGVERVLDLVTSPSLGSLAARDRMSAGDNTEVVIACGRVLQVLIEEQPYLVLPSILHRLDRALDVLEPLTLNTSPRPFFETFTRLPDDPEHGSHVPGSPDADLEKGTEYTQALVMVNVLCHSLSESFQSPSFSHRSPASTFQQTNLADKYVEVIEKLCKISRGCVWEHVLLMENMSPAWKENSLLLDKMDAEILDPDSPERMIKELGYPLPEDDTDSSNIVLDEKDRHTAQFNNTRILRYLLCKTYSTIGLFVQHIGRILLIRRSTDSFQKHLAVTVADQIAVSIREQLAFSPARTHDNVRTRYAYWTVILHQMHRTHIFETMRGGIAHSQALLLVSFVDKLGFLQVEDILMDLIDQAEKKTAETDPALSQYAYAGIRAILGFYIRCVDSRCLLEAPQSQALASRASEKDKSDYFSAPQFLIELRCLATVPINLLWGNNIMLSPGRPIADLIHLLQLVLEGEGEHGAFTRADKIKQSGKISVRKWTPKVPENFNQLRQTFGEDLAREALFRCNDNMSHAQNYCEAMSHPERRYKRTPIPLWEIEAPLRSLVAMATPRAGPSTSTAVQGNADSTPSLPASAPATVEASSMVVDEPETNGDDGEGPDPEIALSTDLFASLSRPAPDLHLSAFPALEEVLRRRQDDTYPPKIHTPPTKEDLDDKRLLLRENVINHCLDILNCVNNDSITFELRDLVNATCKSSEFDGRDSIASTVLASLMSLHVSIDELQALDVEAHTRRFEQIALYAHFLALILKNDQLFVSQTRTELREEIPTLLCFMTPQPGIETYAKCVPMILLILEIMLSKDETPPEVTWEMPKDDDPLDKPRELKFVDPSLAEQALTIEEKMSIFDAILLVLPHVGQDAAFALAVGRVLGILTREEEIATRMGDWSNLSAFFGMLKKLAGSGDYQLQSSVIIVLRHIIEDDEIIRQIMRSEIQNMFITRSSRAALEPSSYVRALSNVALRAPRIFMEVTKEVVAVKPFDPRQDRHYMLDLKKAVSAEQDESQEKPRATLGEVKASKVQEKEADKSEFKPPAADPNGVVSFLLQELLAIKNAEESGSKEVAADADVDMSGSDAHSTHGVEAASRSSREHAFKAEEHVDYIYHTFLLQCLTELLHSYNKAKIEFLSFAWGTDPKSTPSKSKSRLQILRYFLTTLIPVRSIAHADSVEAKKREMVSTWAISVINGLVAKTLEHDYDRSDEENLANKGLDSYVEEPELLYVRQIVIDACLRAFKEAEASNDVPEVRYSKIMKLADLLHRMFTNPREGVPPHDTSINGATEISHRMLAKIVYESGLVSILTASLADLDVSYPGARRVVKYVLRPLKQLTELANYLSQQAPAPPPGVVDLDDDHMFPDVSRSTNEVRDATPNLQYSSIELFDAANDDDIDMEMEEMEDEDQMESYEDGDEYDEEMEFVEEGDNTLSDEDLENEMLDEDGVDDGEEFEEGSDMELDEDNELSMSDPEETSSGESDEDEDHDVDDDDDPDGDEGDVEAEWELDADVGLHEAPTLSEQYETDDLNLDTDNSFQDVLPSLPGLLSLAQLDQPDLEEEDVEAEFDDEGEEDEEDYNGEEDEDEDDHHLHHHHHHHHHLSFHPMGDGDESLIPGIRIRDLLPQHMDSQLVIEQGDGRRPVQIMRNGAIYATGFRTFGVNTRSGRQRGGPADDGTNPLLQRANANARNANQQQDARNLADSLPSQVQRLFRAHGVINVSGNMTTMDRPVEAITERFQIQLDAAGEIERRTRRLIEGLMMTELGRRHPQGPGQLAPTQVVHEHQRVRTDPVSVVHYDVGLTANRWLEEAKMIFGLRLPEIALRLVPAISRMLIPSAMKRQREEEQRVKREKELQEERERKAREDQEAKEKKEREEQEAKEQEERAAREAAEAAVAAAASEEAEQIDEEANEGEAKNEDNEMEGVETTQAGESQPSEATAESSAAAGPTPRVTYRLRDREIDLTSLGIDPEFLDAIPPEMREEVLIAQVMQHRASLGQGSAEAPRFDEEFLAALPPDMREEIIQAEAMELRRQQREEARRRQAGPAPAETVRGAEEMNPEDFLASLTSDLRQQILMEADEEMLSTFPDHIVAEARALGGGRSRGMPQLLRRPRIGGNPANNASSTGVFVDPAERIAPKVHYLQIFEKSGVSSLLRLLFMPQQGSVKALFKEILLAACANRQNRAEIVSILLSILQDGSSDAGSIERSFAHLSAKAKQNSGTAKSPHLKRSESIAMSEMTPLKVVSQCLETLEYLISQNSRVIDFMLTEHETGMGFRPRSIGKGKGKDSRASRFPLNAVLGLLNRKLIVENTPVLDALSHLSQAITAPIVKISEQLNKYVKDQKKEAEKAEAAEKEETATKAEEASQAQSSNAQEATAAQSSGDAAQESKPAEQGDEKPKKVRAPPIPPEVSEQNMRLVVSVIGSRELSSRSFKNILAMISSLSVMPKAKTIFGSELIRVAQELGASILQDLTVLLKEVRKADSASELQRVALARFSPASSDQTKLLRVITSLDYIFDPVRSALHPPFPSDEPKNAEEESEETLRKLYENATFLPLWKTLSQCLSAIRDHKSMNMLNVATFLLPLIEVLMFVFKSSVRKVEKTPTADGGMASPTPESGMEAFFYRFTEDHRKILNELVRQNPKLMSGSFDLMVRNSKVLEFDNKRNYFHRQLHPRSNEPRPHSQLQMTVRRDNIFHDSYRSLYYKKPEEIKFGKLNIKFQDEEGVDAGGVTREWFHELVKQMFNPDYVLFNPIASDRTTFHPNPLSGINNEHLSFFQFVGRIIGKALYESRHLDCHFSQAVYKRILGREVSVKDMEAHDLAYYGSLKWILENDITGEDFTFSAEFENFGSTKVVDLIENGRKEIVTNENKKEYVRLMVNHKLVGSVAEQLDALLKGFFEIVPQSLVSIFTEQELELLISGLPDIDVDDWKSNTEYTGYNASSPQIMWFWRAVRSFDKEERAKLLQFATGTSKVPLNGFKELEGMNGFSRFNIHKDYGGSGGAGASATGAGRRLPSAHTCFNQLDLPLYDSYEVLREQLIVAINQGTGHFGFV